MHTVIKLTHHLKNVTSKPEPKMISRMVEILASLVKPAFPTPDTVDFIRGNAMNWGHNTVTILEEHYTNALEAAMQDLSSILVGL